MEIKGIDKSYLKKTKLTAEEIVDEISYRLNKNIKTLTILSAGWDAYFGDYAVVRAGGNKLWIINDGNVLENNGWVSSRCLL